MGFKPKPKPTDSQKRFAESEYRDPRPGDACTFCEMTEPGDSCVRCLRLKPLPIIRGL